MNITTGCHPIEKTNELIQFQRFPQEIRDVFIQDEL